MRGSVIVFIVVWASTQLPAILGDHNISLICFTRGGLFPDSGNSAKEQQKVFFHAEIVLKSPLRFGLSLEVERIN